MNPQLNKFQLNDKNSKYNLVERTARFAENIIQYLNSLKVNPVNKRIIEQLVGSSGSIGANYCEAVESKSKKDFIHKIGIAKKEIKETIHWIRLLAVCQFTDKTILRQFYKEAYELLLIFSRIVYSSKHNK